jgi:DNA repair protein RadA/Sms
MAAKKQKVGYVCDDCGVEHTSWQGQCNGCKSWNTIKEIKLGTESKNVAKRHTGYAGTNKGIKGPKKLSDVSSKDIKKILIGINEFDRVLGGGVTVGSVNLVSGDPGAGKTTLMSDVVGRLSKMGMTLYVTAEESETQFKNRFENRLAIPHDEENLRIANESDADEIIKFATELEAKYIVVDSIQAIMSDEFTGSAGSISQVKNCAMMLTQFAKQNDVTIFIIGHVNKSNEIAGPKTLVHIVDGLFHIEVNDSELRTIRPSKNRFGDVDTVGLFRMTEKGMISVDNPSKIFLSSLIEPSPGTAITCIRDGTRNLLLEIQSLVTETETDNPQKVSVGVNMNRLKLISAILRKHCKMKGNMDTYVSLVGGLKLPETDSSADLSIAMSIYSSNKDIILGRDTCFMGELSLSGEVRPISGGVQRVKEAIKHGFKTIFIPYANYHKSMEASGVTIVKLKRLQDAIKVLS